VEQPLIKQLHQKFMLPFVFPETTERMQPFVNGTGTDPSWRETMQVSPFAALIDTFFLSLFLLVPSRIGRLSHRDL
jgi:hypothetical protein